MPHNTLAGAALFVLDLSCLYPLFEGRFATTRTDACMRSEDLEAPKPQHAPAALRLWYLFRDAEEDEATSTAGSHGRLGVAC